MASQSLYRKWRSQTFSELVGQEAVIRTLKNALNSNNLTHAYLFTGPRGTGKTSTARLLAKTINCLNAKNGEPCNECSQCREITAGNSFNVIEIDAASNRGIDSIRELREKVQVPPSTGRYKVYILDEAHMLTVEAFNALLKTLEEPPPHAIFVMATTDVHKMLPTVLSRCQRFDFKRITTRQIVEHLVHVAGQEEIHLERSAAELIARAASGGMRDALSLLDQAIAYSGQEVSLAQVQTMLGIADPRAIQKFVLHIAQLDTAGGLHLIHELAEAGADLRQINNQVSEFWRAMMLARAGADIATIIDSTADEVREITQTAQFFSLEELTEGARLFAQNELMQKGQGTPQLGLELAFLACTELHRRTQASGPDLVAASHSARSALPPPENRPASLPPRPVVSRSIDTEPPRTPPAHKELVTAAPPQAQAAQPVVKLEAELETEELPDWENLSYRDEDETYESESRVTTTPVQTNEIPVLIPLQTEPEMVPETSAGGLTVSHVKERWEYVLRRVRTRKNGAKISALLKGYTIVAVEGTTESPLILIKAGADFHFKALQKAEDQQVINWALKVELGQECRVRLLSPTQGFSGVVIPPPANRPGMDGSRLSQRRSSSLSAPSAHRERVQEEKSVYDDEPPPAEPRQAPPPISESRSASVKRPEPPPSVSTSPSSSASLARMNDVRENTTRETTGTQQPGATRKEVLEKKAKNDPVVQEVVRLFKAEIKEIYPK